MKTTTSLTRSSLTEWLTVSDAGGLKSPRLFGKTLLMLGFLFCSAIGFAQLVTNPITGTNPNTANPYTAGQIVDPNVTASGIGRGSGISGANASNRYNASGFTTGNSLSTSEYFEFTITPDAGYEMDFTSFVYTSERSSSGPRVFAFRSSVDNYASNIGTATETGTTISLTAAAYQNRTTAITFRFYGWDSTNSSGTFSINSFTFNGTTCLRPTISAQPTATQTLCVGSPLNLSVTAANATSYQWKKGGVNIPSANSSTYSIGSVVTGDAATYTVDVINSCNTVTSANAVVNVSAQPTASGGGSTSACSNVPVVISGMTASNGTISWTHDGAGSITAGNTTATPTYTPGAGESGTVTLTMTVANAPCTSATAQHTINVTAAPIAVAGSDVDMCVNDGTVNITAGSGSTNGTSVLWTSNGTGTITNDDSLTLATYTPGVGEEGNVTLTLTIGGNSPCGNATSNKILTIRPNPITGATVICAGQTGFLTSNACPALAPATTAATFPTSGINAGTGTAWTNPGNILSNNNSNATVAASAPSFGTVTTTSQALFASGFNFAIPADATIVGIQGTIGRYRSGGIGNVSDVLVTLVKAGAAVGNNKASGSNWSTGETAVNYGSSSDLWGTTWTPADVNNSLFGLALVSTQNASLFTTTTATVDYMNITVTYVAPGTLNWYTVSSGGTAIGSGVSFNPVGVPNSGLATTENNTGLPIVVTYYAECSNVVGCRTPATFTINPLPVVSFSGLGASYCGTPDAIVLTGNQAPAGTFSGPGITDNADGTATFNPAAAGAGVHAIVYSYTDGNTCLNTDSQNVTVIAPDTYYADNDGDGFGDLNNSVQNCTGLPVGYVTNSTDCDDAVLNYLDADGDGFGSDTFVDCGGVLNTDDCDDAVLNYTDVDGDGFGSDTFVACGGVLNTDDCDDALLNYSDVDGDGFGSDTFVACGGVTNTDDCDDNAIQYEDLDNDGFGSMVQVACGLLNNTDCNDNDNTMNAQFDFYVDADGDTYGVGSLVSVCAVDANTPPANYSLNNTDCDDADVSIYQTGELYVDNDNDGYSNGDTATVCYGAAAPTGYVLLPTDIDCNDNVFAINPGHVEVLYNGVDDNCDGNNDEGNLLTTQLLPVSCGATLASIGSLIGIKTVAGHPITGYRIRATNGAEVQVIEKTVPHFTMPAFPSHAYATTYTIEIELQRAGVWMGYYGAACQVSTPAILEEGGASSISPSQCGITLTKINTLIATTSLSGVTGYRYRVTNLTDPFGPNAVQVIDRPQHWFSLQMLTRYNYGTQYRIEVAVKTTGDFGGFGAPCEINSPAAPALINCGGTVASGTATVAATSLSGVTQYRFQIVRQLDNATATIDRPYNYFIFNALPPAAFTAGATYSVRVAVMTTGTWSPFGDVCEITAPGAPAKGVPATAEIAQSEAAFKVAAYPNPFTADFNIDVTSSSERSIELKVYDMLGKLVESRNVQAADLNMQKVGAQYPSGVYNVIVSQDGVVKTLRVIKR